MARRKKHEDHAWDRLDLERLAEQARHSADAARKAAHEAREWAEPRYEAARDWTVPRAKRAYRLGARRAAPIVESAGARAEHLTDVVHDAVVGSVIPGLVGAVKRAGRDPERDREDRSFPWLAVAIPLTIAVAAGAAIVSWARRDPGPESWPERDEDWEFADEQRLRIAHARTSINKAVDSAETTLRHAGDVVTTSVAAAGAAIAEAAVPTARKVRDGAAPVARKVRDATVHEARRVRDATVPVAKKVRDEAGPAARKVRDAAGPAASRVRDAVRTVRSRATGEVVSAMDGVEDVWDDDGGEVAPKKPAPKKKPAAKKTTPKPAKPAE